MRLELLANFNGKTADCAVIKVVRQLQRLVAPVGLDVLALTVEISGIPGIDGQLLGNIARYGCQYRPKTDDPRPSDFRIGKKIESRAQNAILIDRNADLRQGRRADLQASGQLARLDERLLFHVKHPASIGPDAADSER